MLSDSGDLLCQLIRNECVNDGTATSGHETRNAEVLQSYLEGALPVERYEAAAGRSSVVARMDGTDPAAPSLALLSHLDVVPALPQDWRHDPFGAELIDGEIWGRGAIDMLSMTATMASAMRELHRSGFRPRGDIVLIACADEEATAEYGAKYLLEEYRDDVLTDYVFTEGGGWPLDGPPTTKVTWADAEKGIHWARIQVRGIAGHASMPFGADNALVTAAEVVHRIHGHTCPSRPGGAWNQWLGSLDLPGNVRSHLANGLLGSRVTEPELPGQHDVQAHSATHMTITPTCIRGGTAVNSIPEQVEIDVDIRTLPGQNRDDVSAELDTIVGDLHRQVDIEWLYDVPATASATDGRLFDSVSRATAALVPGARPVSNLLVGSTDAAHFRQAGARAYGFALFSEAMTAQRLGSMFHGPNERVDLASLDLCEQLWLSILTDFFDEG